MTTWARAFAGGFLLVFTLLLVGACEVGVPPPPLGVVGLEPQDDSSCQCINGSLYNNTPIPPASTSCGMVVCGKDFLAYVCEQPSPGHVTGWISQPGQPCSSLVCPGVGDFCGAEVVNGEPSAVYSCKGAGQIPADWKVCSGSCKTTGAKTAVCGPAPGVCDCAQLNNGPPTTKCGEQRCAPSGLGDQKTRMVCTTAGWQDLGQSVGQTCEVAGPAICNACAGMQDKDGNEILAPMCGAVVCGLGANNEERWICGKDGWFDLGTSCEDEVPSSGPPGVCPATFLDQLGQVQPVEAWQTFCGGQELPGGAKIGGAKNELYSCERPGVEPKLVKTCGTAQAPAECLRVSKLKAHYPDGDDGGELVRDWDRCDERCPAWTDETWYVTNREVCFGKGEENGRCSRRYLCGEHGISGRIGTKYACIAGGCNHAEGPCDYSEPIPAEDCGATNASWSCTTRDSTYQDLCSSVAPAAAPWGKPPPVASDGEHCSAFKTYQGLSIPASEAFVGKQVCGVGMQKYECATRTVGRPDGWKTLGEPCGTECGECAPDVYGNLKPLCANVAVQWCGIKGCSSSQCDDTTKVPADIPCRSGSGGEIASNVAPAYCGDNPALGVKGDPDMLYTCRAWCPDAVGKGTHPCTKPNELDEPGWSLREYRFSHADLCSHGCAITPATAKADECTFLPGLGFGDALDDIHVQQNLGHYNANWANGGHHLGEDAQSGSATTGATVKAIGAGTVLYSGTNSSSYHAIVVLEHFLVKPGEETPVRYCSFYGHLNQESVKARKVGEKVKRGDDIGAVESWAAIESAHPGVSTGAGDGNSHLHYVILEDGLCKAYTSGSAPCGYDGEAKDLWQIGHDDAGTSQLSILAGVKAGSCDIAGHKLYSPRRFKEAYSAYRVCASAEDCK